MRLALLGPPGSGKGTQAQRICGAFDLVHLASGDILRAEKAAGSPLGKQVTHFIDNGVLVPDQLMIEIMKQKIASLNDKGFVLDGFPRTLPQAKSLSRTLFELERPLELVLNFVVDPAALAQRFGGRRVCPVCLTVYHMESKPPKKAGFCDNDGAALTIRDDDKPAVVKKRIATYEQTVAPLIAYYRRLGNFKTVNTSGSIAAVTTVVLGEIRCHFEEE